MGIGVGNYVCWIIIKKIFDKEMWVLLLLLLGFD